LLRPIAPKLLQFRLTLFAVLHVPLVNNRGILPSIELPAQGGVPGSINTALSAALFIPPTQYYFMTVLYITG
jgi:hypothetical protein